MGCDIHAFVEVRDPKTKQWVLIKEIMDPYGDARDNIATRNYRRFAALAGVRGDGPKPKGIPRDASKGYKWHVKRWGVDGHSHSYLPAKAAATICFQTRYRDPSEKADVYENWEMADYCEKYLDIIQWEGESLDDYRVVFFFDN